MNTILLSVLSMISVSLAEYQTGDIPADFTCTDWNGNTWNLYEQRGRVVLLNFGATW